MLFALGQPTYFEAGHMHLSLPYRRNADGKVFFKTRKFNLRGAQRPVEIKLLFGDASGQFGLRIEKPSGSPAEFSLGYKSRF